MTQKQISDDGVAWLRGTAAPPPLPPLPGGLRLTPARPPLDPPHYLCSPLPSHFRLRPDGAAFHRQLETGSPASERTKTVKQKTKMMTRNFESKKTLSFQGPQKQGKQGKAGKQATNND